MARHRRAALPAIDGRFAGLALILLNVFGLVFLLYGAGTTEATSPVPSDAPHQSMRHSHEA